MFNEILKITPKIDGADLSRMESHLNGRFSKIAKKFGHGLMEAIKGGGITALALGVIDKILNPLQETQAAIDKILGEANDLHVMAKEFNTSSGKIFKLQKLAEAKGLDAGTLNMMMERFQMAVDDAIHDPKKDTSVRKFAVPGQDMADQFFNFIQALQKMKPELRNIVEQEVFGARNVLRMAEFTNADFPKLMAQMHLPSAAAMDPAFNKGAELGDKQHRLAAMRSADDMMNKLAHVNDGMVTGQDINERLKDAAETRKFDSFKTMNSIDIKMNEVKDLLAQTLLQASNVAVGTKDLNQALQVLVKSPLVRGILKGRLGK